MDLGGFSDLEYGTDFQTIGCWFSKGYRTYLIGVRAFLRIGPFGFSGYWISPVFQ
jgi:hypothetical protein